MREAFGLTGVAVFQRRDGAWSISACAEPPDCLRPEDADVDVAVDADIHLVGRGRALPASDRGRLFAPFQRLGDRDPRGLGLGLSVARGFTEAMGGSLTAEDTPGGGLTVVVSLPAALLPSGASP
jgi:K+-sensing histidine kinase KdpD